MIFPLIRIHDTIHYLLKLWPPAKDHHVKNYSLVLNRVSYIHSKYTLINNFLESCALLQQLYSVWRHHFLTVREQCCPLGEGQGQVYNSKKKKKIDQGLKLKGDFSPLALGRSTELVPDNEADHAVLFVDFRS